MVWMWRYPLSAIGATSVWSDLNHPSKANIVIILSNVLNMIFKGLPILVPTFYHCHLSFADQQCSHVYGGHILPSFYWSFHHCWARQLLCVLCFHSGCEHHLQGGGGTRSPRPGKWSVAWYSLRVYIHKGIKVLLISRQENSEEWRFTY